MVETDYTKVMIVVPGEDEGQNAVTLVCLKDGKDLVAKYVYNNHPMLLLTELKKVWIKVQNTKTDVQWFVLLNVRYGLVHVKEGKVTQYVECFHDMFHFVNLMRSLRRFNLEDESEVDLKDEEEILKTCETIINDIIFIAREAGEDIDAFAEKMYDIKETFHSTFITGIMKNMRRLEQYFERVYFIYKENCPVDPEKTMKGFWKKL